MTMKGALGQGSQQRQHPHPARALLGCGEPQTPPLRRSLNVGGDFLAQAAHVDLARVELLRRGWGGGPGQTIPNWQVVGVGRSTQGLKNRPLGGEGRLGQDGGVAVEEVDVGEAGPADVWGQRGSLLGGGWEGGACPTGVPWAALPALQSNHAAC